MQPTPSEDRAGSLTLKRSVLISQQIQKSLFNPATVAKTSMETSTIVLHFGATLLAKARYILAVCSCIHMEN